MDMRGLAHFIRDIRRATNSKREEVARVDEELAKIRATFLDTSAMTTYQRKKYVCKLMFISMLGYPITFGHMEGIRLMAGDTASEKLIGYLAMTVLLNENDALLTLTTHTVYRDLMSNINLNRGLALAAIANTGGKDFAEIMYPGVEQIVLDDLIDGQIRKKALLALLHIYQKYPEIVDVASLVPKAVDLMLSTQGGLALCAAAFLTGCVADESHRLLFKGVARRLIDLLHSIIVEKSTEPDYVYYGVPAPWLQLKTLRLLQHLPVPHRTETRERVVVILRKMIKATDRILRDAQTQQKQRGTQNRVSAMNAVLIEVVSLAIRWNVDASVIVDCVNVVSGFVADKRESNLRYIGLTLMSRFSLVHIPEFDFQAHCRHYQLQIVASLHDNDVSVRKKALEMLAAMCTPTNAPEVIQELMTHLPVSSEATYKVGLILLIALLAEKYALSNGAYVNVLLVILTQAGDVCPPEVAYRAVQAIVNDTAVQKRASSTLFNSLRTKCQLPPLLLAVAGFVLGEFGYQIALHVDSPPHTQLEELARHLSYTTTEARVVLLTSIFKFYNLYDDAGVRARIVDLLRTNSRSAETEVQQRAMEYLSLISYGDAELLSKAVEPMPAFDSLIDIVAERTKLAHGHPDTWTTCLLSNGVDAEEQKHVAELGVTAGPLPAATPAAAVKPSTGVKLVGGVAEAENVKMGSAILDGLFHLNTAQEVTAIQESYTRRRRLLITLLKQSNGMLFGDDNVELWCRQNYSLADARLLITVRARTARRVLNVNMQVIENAAGLLLQLRQRTPSANEALQGVAYFIDIAARSLEPFHDASSVRLTYSVEENGGVLMTHAETLSLPIVTTRFISPYEVRAQTDFSQLFDSVAKTSSYLVFDLANRVTSQDALLVAIQSLGLHAQTSTTSAEIMAVGAHATQRRAKVEYSPVACKVSTTQRGYTLVVYAASETMREVLVKMIEYMLSS